MKHILLLLVLLVTSFPAMAAEKESVFDRIMRTGVIRCGYYVFAPITVKDPKSGEMSGIAVDVMKVIGEKSDLQIEWVEEVSFGNMYAGLQAGRFDAVCTPTWPDAARAKIATFTQAMLYAAVNVYVRADDTRFDKDISGINDSSVKISVQDGSVEEQIAKAQFPKAQRVSIPEMSDSTQLELDVMGKKADVAFIDGNRAEQFLEKNPGSLKQDNKQPLQIFPFKIPVLAKETQFRDYLNIVLEELTNSGEMDTILNRHIKKPELFLRPAKPYQEPVP